MTPAPRELYRGGAATVTRYRDGLQRRGHLCEIFGAAGEGALKTSLEGTIGRFKPDIVHAHDAHRMGLQLLGLRTPWVVSVSGDDLHEGMIDAESGPLTCEVFRRAQRVLVPSASCGALLEERVPEVVGKLDLVPRSAVLPPEGGTDLRRSLGIPKRRFVALLPGGIRPAKGQMRALPMVDVLRSAGADVELIIVGPEQDRTYAAELRAAAEAIDGVRILPAVSSDRMGAAYRDADVVLNTSRFEGMSPTILEAGFMGRPVVAADHGGNRDLIRHKETGLLFGDEESMAKAVLALYRNRSAAGALGVRIREDFTRRFSPEGEIDALLSAYAAA